MFNQLIVHWIHIYFLAMQRN